MAEMGSVARESHLALLCPCSPLKAHAHRVKTLAGVPRLTSASRSKTVSAQWELQYCCGPGC